MLKDEEAIELEKIIRKENNSFFIIFFIIFLIFLLFISLGYYFSNAKLDIIAETDGVVIPSSKVKTVQHLEGGIIKKIFYNSGDVVKKGDLLLELEPVKTLSSFSELEKRLTSLSINIARLRGESDSKKPIYKEDLIKKYPLLIEESKKLYDVRTKNSKLQFLNKRIF